MASSHSARFRSGLGQKPRPVRSWQLQRQRSRQRFDEGVQGKGRESSLAMQNRARGRGRGGRGGTQGERQGSFTGREHCAFQLLRLPNTQIHPLSRIHTAHCFLPLQSFLCNCICGYALSFPNTRCRSAKHLWLHFREKRTNRILNVKVVCSLLCSLGESPWAIFQFTFFLGK